MRISYLFLLVACDAGTKTVTPPPPVPDPGPPPRKIEPPPAPPPAPPVDAAVVADAAPVANRECTRGRNRWNWVEGCGGIGPYKIPRPPSAVAIGGLEKRKTWFAALTKQQQHYYTYWCVDHTDEGEIGYSELCGGTPLVASFDGAVEMIEGGVTAEKTPWIVLDRNGDGAITADELFGDHTPLPDGSLAKNGFEALAQYDANGDGVIDRADPVFARLQLFDDHTLSPLAARITSIELANHRVPHCTRFGCEGERSTMMTTVGSGEVIDVYVRR